MNVILDTNVLISGIFFGGIPGQILQGWRDGKLQLIASPDILEEYIEVISRLAARYPSVETKSLTELILAYCHVIESPPLPQPISADPDDDKFIACALSSSTPVIISGDAHLLDVDGIHDLEIINPAGFVEKYLM